MAKLDKHMHVGTKKGTLTTKRIARAAYIAFVGGSG